MRIPTLMISASLCLCGSAGAQPLANELRSVLDRQLATIAQSLDGVIGYATLDLTSGGEIGRLDRQAFPTASTIKLAILYELFRQAGEGKIALDTPAPLDRSRVVGGDGILKSLATPSLSLRDHAVLMMAVSDNTATNIVIDAVGLAAVTARMQALGAGGILLRRRMMDGAAAARGDENVAPPRDIVRLLRALHAGDGLRPDAHEQLLAVWESGTAGWIRRGVPADVPVLNKLGTLEGVRVDAAIVRAGHRPYAIAVMTTYLKDEGEGERAITDVSRAFYDYFSRLGFGSDHGRQLKRPGS